MTTKKPKLPEPRKDVPIAPLPASAATSDRAITIEARERPTVTCACCGNQKLDVCAVCGN